MCLASSRIDTHYCSYLKANGIGQSILFYEMDMELQVFSFVENFHGFTISQFNIKTVYAEVYLWSVIAIEILVIGSILSVAKAIIPIGFRSW